MGKGNRHIPTRTCISCGSKRNKKELVRLILDAQGLVVLRDDGGKGWGRGAYVCGSKSCLEKLGRGNRLKRAFRRDGPLSVHARLCAEMNDRMLPSAE